MFRSMMIALCALALVACQTAKKVKDDAGEMAGETAKEAGESAENTAKEAGESAKEAGENAKEAGENAKEAGETAKEAGEAAVDEAAAGQLAGELESARASYREDLEGILSSDDLAGAMQGHIEKWHGWVGETMPKAEALQGSEKVKPWIPKLQELKSALEKAKSSLEAENIGDANQALQVWN